jgi:uncharacterized glyoxalase superfamily protein PhnB
MTDTLGARPSGIQLKATVPTFIVADVRATARWYDKTLDFTTAGTVPGIEPYAYASLQRDGVELMFLRVEGYEKPDLTAARPDGVCDAYIRMQGVHGFYEAVRTRTSIRSPLQKQPYGDWEFEVEDPNGYIPVFSEWTG